MYILNTNTRPGQNLFRCGILFVWVPSSIIIVRLPTVGPLAGMFRIFLTGYLKGPIVSSCCITICKYDPDPQQVQLIQFTNNSFKPLLGKFKVPVVPCRFLLLKFPFLKKTQCNTSKSKPMHITKIFELVLRITIRFVQNLHNLYNMQNFFVYLIK